MNRMLGGFALLWALCWMAAAPHASAAAQQPSPEAVVDQFEHNAGVHPGLRRNHVVGVCAAGYFDSSGALARHSRAQVFSAGLRTPVSARFSIPGGRPGAADGQAVVRGLGLAFDLPNGESWRSAMLNAPMFSAPTPSTFFGQLRAAEPDPATGKPDPAKQSAAAEANPDGARLAAWAKARGPSASYATERYNSLVAYRLIDAENHAQAVRWQLEPLADASSGEPAKPAADAYTDLSDRLARGPLRWRLVFTLAQPGDLVDDATRPWGEDNPRIEAGTLVLDQVGRDANGACRDLVFDPLMLPDGIAPSNDPLLRFRSDVYAESFKRRSAENAERRPQP